MNLAYTHIQMEVSIKGSGKQVKGRAVACVSMENPEGMASP
ncbi:hypothetical protein AGMMS49949_09330 [Alphaproteobacteria bacterium]|nr:hypothetical protein AGMMS49949_09330 [Alphaproteobacteria bacterium]GHS98776.1 hypothetical protein AGMMS50296_6660 [Alphaproteobacteria bacterium]